MYNEIKAFNTARQVLIRKTHDLNVVVTAEMAKCKTVDDFQGLIDRLPRDYSGRRRIFEAIIKLESK